MVKGVTAGVRLPRFKSPVCPWAMTSKVFTSGQQSLIVSDHCCVRHLRAAAWAAGDKDQGGIPGPSFPFTKPSLAAIFHCGIYAHTRIRVCICVCI